jgi:hypothetical protein
MGTTELLLQSELESTTFLLIDQLPTRNKAKNCWIKLRRQKPNERLGSEMKC